MAMAMTMGFLACAAILLALVSSFGPITSYHLDALRAVLGLGLCMGIL